MTTEVFREIISKEEEYADAQYREFLNEKHKYTDLDEFFREEGI